MHAQKNDIGSQILPKNAILPVATLAATITGLGSGTGVDRLGYDSAELVVETGAFYSATVGTVNAKVQDSALGTYNGGDWADVTGFAITAISTAAGAQAKKAFNLAGCKRYLRVVLTAAFSDGSSPTVPVVAELILGGADVIPAA